MLTGVVICRRHRYVITYRRIRTQPPRVFRIQVSRTVVIQPRLFVLLLRRKLIRPAVVRIAENYFTRRLRGMSVRQIAQPFFFFRLLLYPQLSVRRIFYPLVFIAFKIGYELRTSQVVGMIIIPVLPLVALPVARFKLTRLLRYNSRFTQVYVLRILPVGQSRVRVPRPHGVEVECFT